MNIQKYVNYINHSLYTPDTFHRRFDLDLPTSENDPGWLNQAKRIGLLSLPFLSLCRPIGSLLSIGLGAIRAITHLSGAISAESAQEWKNFSFALFQTALAVFSVASALFNFTIGLGCTTAIETLQGAVNVIQALREGDFQRSVEEALQTIASTLYLGFMVVGSLELMLLFTLLQATVSFFQAHGEILQGRYLEGAAKVAFGCIRLHQARGYVQQIEQRNRFFAIQKYASLIRRALKGREIRHLLESPLSDLIEQIDEKRTAIDTLDFGAHFHGHGKALVKGANLSFRTTVEDGHEITELDFKVNHVFREKIQDTIDEFSKMDRKEMNEILAFTQSHAKGIRIEKNQSLPLGNDEIGNATKITLDGLGSIYIGSTPDLPNMYDRVVVQMDANKNLYDFHELMAFLDIDQALQFSAREDIDRLKMGHLYRIFYPREATPFERTEEFFTLPLEALKEKMIEKSPSMKQIFEDYFDRMRPGEILPGRVRYQVDGLAEKAYDAGARALSAVVYGAYSDAALFERIASILNTGMLSGEMRARGELNSDGLSSGADFYSGGSDSVFTQMITEKNCREKLDFNNMYYHGQARFLLSLDALEMGTYQYFHDSFGNRLLEKNWFQDDYLERPGILEFIEGLQNAPTSPWGWNQYSGHEVMLKERVAPSYFQGLILQSEQTKTDLMNYLRGRDIIQLDVSGNETILGVAAGRFFRVGTHISEELLTG